jgi:hypothetical protein
MNPHNALHRQVITAARFHPTSCNIFAYSTSKGAIKICDMRAAALCDRHAKSFEEPLDPSSRYPPPPHTHTPTHTHTLLLRIAVFCTSPASTHSQHSQAIRTRSLTHRSYSHFSRALTTLYRSFFSEIIASTSDIEFSHGGNYFLSRDYLSIKIWDARKEGPPVQV